MEGHPREGDFLRLVESRHASVQRDAPEVDAANSAVGRETQHLAPGAFQSELTNGDVRTLSEQGLRQLPRVAQFEVEDGAASQQFDHSRHSVNTGACG